MDGVMDDRVPGGLPRRPPRQLRACSSCENPTLNADLCRSCADDAAVDAPCPRPTDIACEPEPCWCRRPNAEYRP